MNMHHTPGRASPSVDPVSGIGTARVPQISVHAYGDAPETIAALATAAGDRRMSRAQIKVQAGGIGAAIEHYRAAPTPNLLVVESCGGASELLGQLDQLADVCGPDTKVLVIGHANDVALYRELLAHGVSEYVVAPVEPLAFVAAVAALYPSDGASKLGRSFVFVGAKGGVGSSTLAHNVAAILARSYESDVILADLDLPFGSAALGLNLEPGPGTAQAVQDSARLDDVLLERLLTKSGEHLSVLSAPGDLGQSYDLPEGAFERLLELTQASVPFVVFDLPHVWTAWARKTLLQADEVVVTAAPDLVSLRNTKNLVELLKEARANDGPPRVVLNQTGVRKRQEITPEKFAAALELELAACIPFDAATFSRAEGEGRLISDTAPSSVAGRSLASLTQALTGQSRAGRAGNGRFSLRRLWGGR